MDSRTIIAHLYNRESAPRYGLRDNVWRDTLKKWATQGLPLDSEGRPVSPEEHFGFDMVGCGGFEWRAILQPDEIIEKTDEWRIVRDGNGAEFKWWNDKSGTPEHVAFDMDCRDKWETRYKPHVVGSATKRATPEALDAMRKKLEQGHAAGKWVDMGFRGLWENMRGAFGDITLYENMLLDPDWIKDYCGTYADLYREEFELAVNEAGTPDGVWFYDDLGYKGATFCAPALYEELIFPFYADLIAFIHGHGVKVTLHSCGYAESIMDLVVSVGFDAINPLEVKAGNDALKMAELYGDKLVFVGGLDARVLESHDRALIRKEVTDLVVGMKERGGRFVFGSDHSLSTIIDYQDFCYAIEVCKEHWSL